MGIRKPIIGVIFKGVDVTSDLTAFLKGFRYKDKIAGDSPDIEIVLEDREKIWQREWFPSTGDRFDFSLQYEGEGAILEGKGFEIDLIDFTFDSSGDTLRIGAQQTPFTKSLREKRSLEYVNMSLLDILQSIASRQGLVVTGKVFDVQFKRITQNEESDLEFLQRLSEFGQLFKIEGNNLIFYNWDDLILQRPFFSANRNGIQRLTATKKLTEIYKEVEIIYQGDDGEIINGGRIKAFPPNKSEDILRISTRVEDASQANAKAKEALRSANSKEWTGQLSVDGDYFYKAGINFNLREFGDFDGMWQISEAEHSFSPNFGWKCELNIYRISGYYQ